MTGRIRTLKPEWLDDELLAAASDEARVLSVALILMADDYGLGRAAPATLAAGAWRYQLEHEDGAHAAEVLARASRALRELHAIRFVELYEVDRQRYFAIRNWAKHQKVDRPSKPRIPPPPPPDSSKNLHPREETPRLSRDPRETSSSVPRGTRDGPPTSDLRPGPVPPTGTERARTADRDTLATAWRVGYVRRFERVTATTHSGPSGEHMATLIDAALAQPDPEAFVERALDGFFGTPRFRSQRPPFAPRYLAENPAGHAAAATSPSGVTDARNAELVAGIPRLEVT